MISPGLLAVLACPVCLEDRGCEACSREAGGHEICTRDYTTRIRCACGGPDKKTLRVDGGALRCACCGATYAFREDDAYVALLPPWEKGIETQYADHAFHEKLRVRDTPPVLSAGVKAEMTRRLLSLRPGDRVVDLGCGPGKFALFHSGRGQSVVGVDIAPFFLARARATIDLVVADLRRLPFRKSAFPRAYSLDVLEHLDEPGVLDVLCEARRVLKPGGRLLVYTHAMESSWLAGFQRGVNRLARALGRLGWIDQERERLRKSDHVNAIRSHEHFETLCAAAGFVVRKRRYYNVVFKAIFEDLLLRLYERARQRRHSEENAPRAERLEDPGQASPGRGIQLAARLLTELLMLDVALFGWLRTGPFFGLLEAQEAGAPVTRFAHQDTAEEPAP